MSSWQITKKWKVLGKWNKVFLSLTTFWTLMILTSPLIITDGETGDLSGSVGIYDNKEVIQNMNPLSKLIYYIGDLNCHQLSQRSYEYNENQMPFCARDVGIFAGLTFGFVWALGRRIELTLPMIILALIPIGLDGTIQLFTDYESTNIRRVATGLIAGIVTGISLKIIADSLDKKY
ncbi:MAG: hypothetical protein CXT75_02375 [Methanobacteriota archaeon]|jgi:uncharacterized membrane protein|nr:MAG: hypothetical protein CXT75_02375 [Euryarchaeota archaeon]